MLPSSSPRCSWMSNRNTASTKPSHMLIRLEKENNNHLNVLLKCRFNTASNLWQSLDSKGQLTSDHGQTISAALVVKAKVMDACTIAPYFQNKQERYYCRSGDRETIDAPRIKLIDRYIPPLSSWFWFLLHFNLSLLPIFPKRHLLLLSQTSRIHDNKLVVVLYFNNLILAKDQNPDSPESRLQRDTKKSIPTCWILCLS